MALPKHLDGTGDPDSLAGDAGNDVLNGFAGDDLLFGKGGADFLRGGDGTDMLDGGAGDDAMIGGSGSDTYVVESTIELGQIVELTADSGIDLVKSAVSVYLLPDTIEDLRLTGTAFNGTGNINDNRITGNAVANTLTGGYGADTVLGGGGNDTLGVSSIGDTLIGGAGSDTYKFGNHISPPIIQGFLPGTDHLSFGDNTYGLALAFAEGELYAADGAHTAHDSDDRFIYDTNSGKLYYDPDGSSGGTAASLIAKLAGAPELTAADISVYHEQFAHPT